MHVLFASGALNACCGFIPPFLDSSVLGTTRLFMGSSVFENGLWLPVSCITGLLLSTWHVGRRSDFQRDTNAQRARHALIVGAGEGGQILARHLDQHKQLGYVFKGYVDPNHHTDPRLLGKPDDLAEIATTHFIDDVFIAMPPEQEMVDRILSEARKGRFTVKLMQQFAVEESGADDYEFIGTLPAISLHEPIPTAGLALKRVMDVVLGSLLLVLAAPIMLLTALIVKFDSQGPIIYSSWRVGKKGRKFICHKFRTMVENADELKSHLLPFNERKGLFFKIAEDPRLTRVGPFLRKYSLDELPQIWSVMKGDMSLVGPRPASLDEYHQYGPEQLRRLRVTPGLSGLWQVTARRDPSFDTYLALDLEYFEKWSIWLDIKILFRTVPAVLRGGGI